jgi:hypothetical protein
LIVPAWNIAYHNSRHFLYFEIGLPRKSHQTAGRRRRSMKRLLETQVEIWQGHGIRAAPRGNTNRRTYDIQCRHRDGATEWGDKLILLEGHECILRCQIAIHIQM